MNIALLLKTSDLNPKILEDRGAYIQAVRQGVSGKIVEQAVKALGERELFVRLLSTSSGNLNRLYHSKLLSKVQTEGVLDTLKVFDEAINVFGDENLAKEWLHTSIPALNGESPVSLCDTFEGRKLVRETLSAIEYGEFA
ncbi:antitoxin Xre/MbcA/ParS toxin-binding domain-containing protein [Myxosarcina sp. GI1]|uniref:antitoxin Xre/MbcA/ParS toxin-binding domain-containing protein n=1 Tax=Myxosarcina sp. GI1 TaxID=1541065 RepID=UPI00068DE164|nr:antitoxin Xre/MbcA/ParS toxin-binding domain-containing protein [Myxosarcina sp. GI1]